MIKIIDSFWDDYRFLSNFWPCKVTLDGVEYPSVENAYQAAKFPPAQRMVFTGCTPGNAKRYGKQAPFDIRWHREKLHIMFALLHQKFSAANPELRAQLIATHPAELIEGNTWGDRFWGVCKGEGQNILGLRLMLERDAAIAATQSHHENSL